MAENQTLKLQQVICPACKRPINTFNPNKLMAECPYCHSKLVNPLINPKDFPVPERIILFTTNENTFENALVNTLINRDYVPTDIFDSISTGDVIQAYLPMYLYEGTYNASWSCESSYEEESANSDKKVTKWRPQNGNAAGNFSFLCLANEGNEIPDELRKFTSLFPYDVMMSKEFQEELIDVNDDNLMTLERNADVTLVWQRHGKEMVEKTAENAALKQIGNQNIRNFRASSSHQLTTTGRYVLAPFWFVYYNYKGQQYHFLMDGIGARTSFTNPINQEEVEFVNKKKKVLRIVNWLWPLALVFWGIFNFVVGLIVLAAWFIARILVKKNIVKQIEDRLNESKAKRMEGAKRIGA